MSIVNVNNLNPNGNDVVTVGSVADDTTGARFGIIPAPGGDPLLGSSIVLGHEALSSAGNKFSVTAIGTNAGAACTTVTGSTYVGAQAGQAASTANYAVGVGYQAGFSGGQQGTYVGSEAGENSTGIQNVCIGAKAGLHLTTGERNVLIGPYAGSNQDFPVDGIQTGSNNIVLQTGVGDFDLGTDISNAVVLGSTSQTAIYAGVTTITALSDARDKKDVKEISAGLDFIKELKPVDFIWDERKESGKRDIKDCGFLAQDLKEAEDKHGVADYLRLVDDRNPEKLLASYGRLLPVMVKAIQELSARVEALEA